MLLRVDFRTPTESGNNLTEIKEEKPKPADESEFLTTVLTLMRDLILDQIEELETVMKDKTISGEQRLKDVMSMLKVLQGAEQMAERKKKNEHGTTERGMDTLEFRRQLEKQIDGLVDEKPKEAVS